MQFLLIAYDGTDPEAQERRLKVREEHLGKIAVLKKNRECLFGGAILDEAGKMIGFMIVYDFPIGSRWMRLKAEPYITEGVWKKLKFNLSVLQKLNRTIRKSENSRYPMRKKSLAARPCNRPIAAKHMLFCLPDIAI